MLEKKVRFRVFVAVSMKFWFGNVRLNWSTIAAFNWEDAGFVVWFWG